MQLIPGVVLFAFIFAAIGALVATIGPNPQPDEATIALLFVGGMTCYMAMLTAVMIWTFWISTRTMFVWPLVADRGYDVYSAWNESWRASKVRFWELLLLNFLAGLIGGLGLYLCYVGVIFSLPIYFLVIAAAYEDRFR
jgi:membrane-anchored glycerophosphoryl diester phosphodiesterase (GDPDase)